MENTSLNVIPQQSPQTTPSHCTDVDEMVGATIPAHISSTIPVTTSTVAAVTQSNANFGNPLVYSLLLNFHIDLLKIISMGLTRCLDFDGYIHSSLLSNKNNHNFLENNQAQYVLRFAG